MARKQAVETNEQLIKRTMSAISDRNMTLTARRNEALSSFRRAAEELKFVNEGLQETAKVADDMIDFFSTYKANTTQAISDNSAVAQRILEIIGE